MGDPDDEPRASEDTASLAAPKARTLDLASLDETVWARLLDALDPLFDLPDEFRNDAVATLARGDPIVADALRALLAADRAIAALLDRPAFLDADEPGRGRDDEPS